MSQTPLIGYTVEQIARLLEPLGEPSYRAKQIYKWIHHQKVSSFQEMSNLPKSLRQELEAHFTLSTFELVRRQVAQDGTEKYLWKLQDGRMVESVLIPEARRNTICISSQVGCALGCKFCATGAMGFIRNLTTGEIVEQVIRVQQMTSHRITNVVFMGMGEPFLNYGRAIQAARILADPEGAAIANRRITFSTSGIPHKIYRFTDEKHPYSLAISLHAPNQQIREQIMPMAKKFPLDDLLESVYYYMRASKRNRVTFEYVLLEGINDEVRHARELIRLLSPIRCKLNVIPCNENYLGFRPPSEEKIRRFVDVLMDAPFTVTVRKNRGEEITAACGQLAVEVSEEVKFIKI